MTESNALAPQRDVESEFYWQGLERKELLLQRCNHCNKARFPAMPGCCYCGKDGHTIVKATGRAELYSWVVVHYPFNPALKDEVPYAVGTMQLAEGCRLVARLEDHKDLKPGTAFDVFFVEHPGGVEHAGWTEARFRKI